VEVGEHNYGKLPSGADDMRFYIYIGGTQFLQHFDAKSSVVNELQCVSRKEKVNEEDVNGLFDIMWAKPAGKHEPVVVTGGELRGLLDVRDGNSGYVQTARFNLLTAPPSGIDMRIDLSAGGPVTLSLTFNEFVRDVGSISADGLASYLETQINQALHDQAGIEITPDNRARVTTTAGGALLIDLGGVTMSALSPPTPVTAVIERFIFTAPAETKQALNLTEIASGGTGQTLVSGSDIVRARETEGYKGIPYYLRKLNEYVRTYAMAFNEGFIDGDTDKKITPDEVLTGHAQGYNINQEPGEPPAGVRFFTMADSHGSALGTGDFLMMGDLRMPSLYGLDPDDPTYADNINAIYNAYQKVTAKNFSVSSDVLNDVSLIATSAKAGDVEDNTNLLAVISQRFNRHMFSEGSAEDFMQALTTDAAVDTSQAEFLLDSQDKFIGLLETRRMSISGVSESEEFAEMVKQQHAYNASAMMINTFNEIYNTLINGLGLY
ncbi:MAG: hypothetical protein LBU58_03940, partial [Clostridiales bacterium]|nr:hypothetical protein [Clostridiales bacterium]